MTIGAIVTAVVVGAAVGALGRLVVPGRVAAPWLTVLTGVAAALAGAWLGHGVLGWGDGGLSSPVALLQILLAAVGVVAAASLGTRRRA
ncbi:MAG TPA: GlsB/YeaQ/YmgE family stress response membrane protein [Thermomonospora sp.]|nr:GlsB/YeaQ/YmgE family stress response membrane protein [Thermomonospora sp.]